MFNSIRQKYTAHTRPFRLPWNCTKHILFILHLPQHCAHPYIWLGVFRIARARAFHSDIVTNTMCASVELCAIHIRHSGIGYSCIMFVSPNFSINCCRLSHDCIATICSQWQYVRLYKCEAIADHRIRIVHIRIPIRVQIYYCNANAVAWTRRELCGLWPHRPKTTESVFGMHTLNTHAEHTTLLFTHRAICESVKVKCGVCLKLLTDTIFLCTQLTIVDKYGT